MSDTFDVIVIGSGPGGYVCAIRASQLGLKVAVVEKRTTHGGTCLNIGCIPSKALLHASERYHEAEHDFGHLGIKVSPKLDLTAMMKHKTDVVDANVGGIGFLFKKNKITAFHGTGQIIRQGVVSVTNDKGETQELKAQSIVIATGSDSTPLPGVTCDEKRILTSTGALELDAVPKSLIVVGAGVIGLELGSVWARLGADVTVVEYLDRIVPGIDDEIAKTFKRALTKQGFSFMLGQKVLSIKEKGKSVAVDIEANKDGKTTTLSADHVLVAIGRRPYTEGLGLDKLGVERDSQGFIVIDKGYQTSVAGVYAIGDAVPGAMLAHKAEDEGVAVAELLAGKSGHVNYNIIPGVIYTSPEVATVGETEESLKAAKVDYKVGKFSLVGNGRARAMRATDGMVKVLACAKTDRLLGAHMVGPGAGDIIHEAAVLMEFAGSSEDLARTCHAHPTLSEAMKEAALAVDGRAIHA